MVNYLHFHYDELSLKGKNKRKFEILLKNNIALFLKKFNITKADLKIEYGFLSLVLDKDFTQVKELLEVLKNIPGLNHIAEVYRMDIEGNELDYAEIVKFVKYNVEKHPEYKTFRASCRRVYKYFPMKSMDIAMEVGHHVLEAIPELSVSLKEYDFNVQLIIHEKELFLTMNRVEGIGGLPVGTAGKVVSLLSGGIDSPVASAMMLKRGAEVILTHFQNQSINQDAVADKINQLAEQLSTLHANLKLYIVPFDELQKEIIKHIPGDYRMIVYKRIMLKISEEIAKKEKAKALITGDSLSQVASQTLDNIYTIYEAVKLPIFSPLIGLNKNEVVKIAEKIGTFEISILPYGDCCSLLLSSHPQTHSKLETVLDMEKSLEIEELIVDAIDKAVISYHHGK